MKTVIATFFRALIDLTNGRKIDHIRVVARADTSTSDSTLRLTA